MKKINVEHFEQPGDSGVVLRVPGRHFPGYLIPGDALHALLQEAHDLTSRSMQGDNATLTDQCRRLETKINHMMKSYEAALISEGEALPYSKQLWEI